MRKTLSTERTN